MSTTTLVLPDVLMAELRAAAAQPLETAAVVLANVVGNQRDGVRLLGREWHAVPEAAYLRREHDALTIASDGYVPALGRAADIGASAIWVHTHPGYASSPQPSDADRTVDHQLAELFRSRTGSDYYGTLIASPSEGGISFTGQLTTISVEQSIDQLWAVGERFSLIHAHGIAPVHSLPEMFDRNVRAFGGAIQYVLGELRIAVVGCGGTGSAVAEQLVRLGVRHLLLVDPDVLSESNLTRVYGSTHRDIGRRKVHVLADHLRRIAPDVVITPVASMVTVEATARMLTSCDLIFGCTDDNAGRMVLSRLASFYLTPVIDCGVLLSSDADDQLGGIDARVTIMTPGVACLICRNRIDLQRATSELLTPSERRRREDEGYAAALAGIEPAVVTYTTLTASIAVSELLERLVGFGPTPVPGEVLARCHDRELSTNVKMPQPGHYCDPVSGKLGQGDIEPFLGQTWAG